MATVESKKFDSDFKQEVYDGLTAFPKYLSSKYFYDEKGDKLFQDIMATDEYYVTNAEREVFEHNTKDIILSFMEQGTSFDVLELGAGDGTKTQILIKELLLTNADFTYVPVDISANALQLLENRFTALFPNLAFEPLQGEYFKVLKDFQNYSDRRKVILFLGSNIGNLPHPRAIEFLKGLHATMNERDYLFIGMDQKKNPEVIRAAYNDKQGITAKFNKNVLHRINRELGGNFQVDKFLHYPMYNPESGTAKSFLISIEKQEVAIDSLNLQLHFNEWETIHTEISQKYDEHSVKWIMDQSGFEVNRFFEDANRYFKNYLLTKK